MGPKLPFSIELHTEKYCGEGEDYRDMVNRVASGLKDSEAHWEILREIIGDMRFLFAGRIQAAIGSLRQVTPYNCYVSGTILDNFTGQGGIMMRALEAAETMRMGGGIGYDFSTLRPKGTLIKSLMSKSSGPVPFMGIYNEVCICTSSSGNRRGAQMAVMRVDHPDIEEFIHVKGRDAEGNETVLKGFNLSVAVTDKFMVAVKFDYPFDLVFENVVYKTIQARSLWEMIMRSTWDYAEPGVIFIDRINKMNNLYYCETIAATNPCVTGDTPILTDKGYVDIKDVVGYQIKIWNGDSFEPVVPFFTGLNRVFDVSLSDNTTLTCTSNHEFLIENKGKVQTLSLQKGDKLQKFPMPIITAGHDWKEDAYSQGFYSGDGFKDKDRSWVYREKHCCIPRLKGNVGKEHSERGFRQWYHGWMRNKTEVPVHTTSAYCIDWFAGLLDSDGTVVKTKNGNGLQISSVEKEFLLKVKLMLTRLGVRAKVSKGRSESYRSLPDGKGGHKAYLCKEDYKILLNNMDTWSLVNQGLKTERLKIHDGKPQRDSRRFVCVVGIVERPTEETFCFTEKLSGRGTFNGVVTSQCGEQPLPPFGACLLGSFNLTKYINDSDSTFIFDWDQFISDVPHIVRALDNVIDQAIYPLKEQELEAKNKRRMGIGITGLANAGEVLGFPYGSIEFLRFEERVLQTLRDECYRASIQLAKEKGAFPLYDFSKYIHGAFIQTLPTDILDGIKEHGIRNSHLLSIAPTGTISLTADNISSGIEPVFNYSFEREILMNGGKTIELVEDYGYRVWGVEGKRCQEVTAEEHVAVLTTAQKYVDSAVSKTCNVTVKMPWEDFKNIYVTAWKDGAKGCTTFTEGGKRAGILQNIGEEGEACYIDATTGRHECE